MVKKTLQRSHNYPGKQPPRYYIVVLAAMNYPIPANPQEVVALRQKPVSEELIAAAIAGVVQVARSRGQSLDDLMAEVMADDALLDVKQRSSLSQIVATAWEKLP